MNLRRTIRVEVRAELLRWARERSGLDIAALDKRFPHLDAWERGDAQPTLKQLEAFANATHTPLGYGIMDMRLRLYFDRLGDLAVPVPPRGEQTRILELVRTETSQLDRMHQATDRTIALLKERCAALIAAAVTGKIEPREMMTNARDE